METLQAQQATTATQTTPKPAPYSLRPYQREAVTRAVSHFRSNSTANGIEVLPTGSGKSLIIANIALELDEPILVFQPSKEILEQNFSKLSAYGLVPCSIYSASAGKKELNRVTFITIGSVIRHLDIIAGYRYAIIDECHYVNAKNDETMYNRLITTLGLKVVGLTATPYRMHTNSFGSQLKFLTRTRPRLFSEVLYVVQVRELLEQGFLARVNYYCPQMRFNTQNLKVNSTGNDYTDQSVLSEYKRSNFYESIEEIIFRLLRVNRRRILVFTKFVEEAELLARKIPRAAIVTGETPKAERERILRNFKAGIIEVVCNVGVLTTGFDYPELDTVVMARPTRSLSLYYQIVGRAIRPFKGKEAWFIDLCGTYRRFGKVENLELRNDRYGWAVYNAENGRQLTNVDLSDD